MRMNFVKKFLGLTVLYAALIIGIFAIQFRNDSAASEKVGALRVSLGKTGDGETLPGKMSAAFNGVTFFVDGDNLAKILFEGPDGEKPAPLLSWQMTSPLSCEFNFAENVSLEFSMSDETPEARLSIKAALPPNAIEFSIPYKLAPDLSVSSRAQNRARFARGENRFDIFAAKISDGEISFTKEKSAASLSRFEGPEAFSFDDAAKLEGGDAASFAKAVDALKQRLVSSFAAQSQDGAALSEKSVAAYVAAMAERGRYTEAVAAVPAEFKSSGRRTYLSAPYFGSLPALAPSLESHVARLKAAAAQGGLPAFGVERMDDFIRISRSSASARALLRAAAQVTADSVSLGDAVNILRVHNSLMQKDKSAANEFDGGARECVKKIEASCSAQNGGVVVSEDGAPLDDLRAAEAGDALILFGEISSEENVARCGRMVALGVLSRLESFDLRSLSELYTTLVHGNTYYPHFVPLAQEDGAPVYAWTCAAGVSYKKADGEIILTINSRPAYSHYLMVSGIKPFNSIYIYDVAFRTDPRFESYNSSGYVYRAESNMLLLKSRHHLASETVRLVYSSPKPAQAQASPEEPAQETAPAPQAQTPEAQEAAE